MLVKSVDAVEENVATGMSVASPASEENDEQGEDGGTVHLLLLKDIGSVKLREEYPFPLF